MIVAATKETFPGERRVALVPALVPGLIKAGLEIHVQSGAGEAAGFSDAQYAERGAKIVDSRAEAFAADCVLSVRALGANPVVGLADLELMRAGQTLIAMADPLGRPAEAEKLAERGVTLFALELMPRTTRAQSMDVLSSQATVAGYRAVLLAALTLPKMFPMMTTAAGTLTPAKVFIVGAGVAGLQAIASARRLGAVTSAYDVRPVVKEQVQSLGARFIEFELAAADAQTQGGYAKAMDEDFYRRQREMMKRVVAENDVVITTAAVPGRKAPTLVTAEMVAGMAPGSVIVDAAAERGGNCELTQPDEIVVSGGVTILGPTNLPSDVPNHASQMFAKNVVTFLTHLVKDGKLVINLDDEITRETLVTRDGKVVHARVLEQRTGG
ncbi:MAG TPA: Re/Si-specific NAD(P)(+) transhydrogenase subunit alpha [Pirellulales bacterium]|jgi:NAD(P) transhydrogenase subunit alpha